MDTSRMRPSCRNPEKKIRVRLNRSAHGSELPVVRHLVKARHAGVLAVAAAAGVLAMAGPAVAGPAVADVSISPTSAEQGSGANLTFRVSNTAKSAITRVTLVLPPDSPVAEVYPLSVDDWAPQTTQQKLAKPLTTIHGGTPVTVTAKDITWIAMQGKAIAPGRYADLSIALGPLPTLSQMRFTVQPTYADGAGPAMSPVLLKLTPAAPGAAAGHAGHGGAPGGGAATGGSDAEGAAFAAVVAQAEQGPSWWSILGWIAAGLAGIGAVVAVLRARRKPAPDGGMREDADVTGTDDAAEKEAVTAGTGAAKVRASSWRYRDDP
jgi:uncharacterized protein YcnI